MNFSFIIKYCINNHLNLNCLYSILLTPRSHSIFIIEGGSQIHNLNIYLKLLIFPFSVSVFDKPKPISDSTLMYEC